MKFWIQSSKVISEEIEADTGYFQLSLIFIITEKEHEKTHERRQSPNGDKKTGK